MLQCKIEKLSTNCCAGTQEIMESTQISCALGEQLDDNFSKLPATISAKTHCEFYAQNWMQNFCQMFHIVTIDMINEAVN